MPKQLKFLLKLNFIVNKLFFHNQPPKQLQLQVQLQLQLQLQLQHQQTQVILFLSIALYMCDITTERNAG